jgi:hypothetical protein
MKDVSCKNRLLENGAATLVVVMVLFLVMALLAAYANRSQMFEQRMASSYFRGTVAQQASEAGLEWAISMLNAGKIDAACQPSVASGSARFVDKYLTVSPVDRAITSFSNTEFRADCRFTANAWTCRCPDSGTRTTPSALNSDSIVPSFGIKISNGGNAGSETIALLSTGCTDSVVDNCENSNSVRITRRQLATGLQRYLLTLVPAMRSPPAAPLVVKGELTSTGAGLGLHNTDPRSAGLLYTVGGGVSGLVESRLESVPGTLASMARVSNDSNLAGMSADVFFKSFLGATKERYVQHPAIRKVTCAGNCAAALSTAYDAGKRILYVDGDLTISSVVTLGTVDEPLLIFASGNVTITGPMELRGVLVVGQDLTWTKSVSGLSLITGAVLVSRNAATTGAVDILHSQAIMNQLQNRIGSYVKVPGSWADETEK